MTELFAHDFTRERLEECIAGATLPETPLDFYSTPHWFDNLAQTCLGETAQLTVHQVKEQGTGLVLALQQQRRPAGPFRARALATLTNFYTCRYEPPGLADAPDPAALVEHWAISLRARTDRPDEIRLDTLSRASDTKALADGLRAGGYWVEVFDHFGTWYLPVPAPDFDAYWSARPSRLQNTITRKSKQLAKLHAVEAVVYKTAEDTGAAIRDYEAVYARSWQGAEPFPDFTPGLLRYGLGTGEVQVWVLLADRTPIAAQIWTVRAGRATLFKLAYDQGFKSKSPGTILSWHAMRGIFEGETIREIDLGRGDDHYKRDWLPERRQVHGIVAYEPFSLPGQWLAARNFAPRYLRKMVRFSDQSTR